LSVSTAFETSSFTFEASLQVHEILLSFSRSTKGTCAAALDNENGFHYLHECMYVCVCLAVTESEVEAAIAGGAHTREAVTRACRAGGDCGACHGMIETKIEDHLETAVSGVISCPGPRPATLTGPQHAAQPLAPVHADLVPAEALVRDRSRAA
jgi:bacterioferritin-associated ferredoxin